MEVCVGTQQESCHAPLKLSPAIAAIDIVALVVAACSPADPTPTPPADTVAAGESFDLRVGQSDVVRLGDGRTVRVTLAGVANDSRCATDVTCIRAGEAFVSLEVQPQGAAATGVTLEVSPDGRASVEAGGVAVQSSSLLPAPVSTRQIDPSEYIVTLAVRER